jgi:hypothetical protein
MLKLQCKTTFNSTFVDKKNHQHRTRVDLGIMFLKNVVLYEIYSKKIHSDRILFAHLCTCQSRLLQSKVPLTFSDECYWMQI